MKMKMPLFLNNKSGTWYCLRNQILKKEFAFLLFYQFNLKVELPWKKNKTNYAYVGNSLLETC